MKSRENDFKPDISIIYMNLASAFSKSNKFQEALDYIDKAKEIQDKVFQGNDSQVGMRNFIEGNIYKNKDNLERAYTCFQTALDIFIELHGESHLDTAKAYCGKAEVLYLQDKEAEALGIFKKGVNIIQNTIGDRCPDLFTYLITIGDILDRLEQPIEALEYYYKAIMLGGNYLSIQYIDKEFEEILDRMGKIYKEVYENGESGLISEEVHNWIKKHMLE